MNNKIKKIKKIELHLHLDGSVSKELASKLSGLDLDTVSSKMVLNDNCLNLSKYLDKFTFPINLMQTKENLKLIAKDLVDRLEKDNVIYAEIRFAPILHTKAGLSLEAVIDSVLEGFNENKTVKTNLILCMLRGLDKKDNLKIIELASKYLNKGVVAIDLAGDEAKYRLKEYEDLFKIIKEKNIPFTIHAGEVLKDDIELAIKLGAKRLGHGVKIIDSEELLTKIKEKNILLEVCPTSNIHTNAFNNYESHPIYNLYKKGINISINTDNRTVSNISLNQEYEKLAEIFDFTKEDFMKINKNAINYSFLPPLEKIKILEKLKRD